MVWDAQKLKLLVNKEKDIGDLFQPSKIFVQKHRNYCCLDKTSKTLAASYTDQQTYW